MFGYYLELAWRSLKRTPVLSALMVLTIALGIGASMTTLTVERLLSGDPVPARSATLYHPQVNPTLPPRMDTEPTSAMDYRSAVELWGAQLAERQVLVANSPVRVNVPGSGTSPLPRQLLLTTRDFFGMFSAPFRFGGAWTLRDEARRAPVAVISAALNRRLFGGADSVGRSVLLDDREVRIVGVLAPWRPVPRFYDVWNGHYMQGKTGSFYQRAEDVYLPFFTGLDIFTPPEHAISVHFCWATGIPHGPMESWPCAWVSLWVQLSTPQKVNAYRRFLANYAEQQKRAGRFRSAATRMPDLMSWLAWNDVVPASVRVQAWMALAFLLICLVNTSGLLLSRFMRRSGEIGVRRAMGASRRSVFAQCLTESGLVGVMGGVGGWFLTLLGLWIVRQQPSPYADLAQMNLPMFAASFLTAVGASLAAGVLPAWRASRVSIALQLNLL
ncbi:MAG TPA: FtsX-like permease family protein [Rhodanobacteraceae bacterium]